MPRESPASPNAIYAARPIIEVDGQRNDTVLQQLVELVVRESEGGLSSLEARFLNIRNTERGGTDLAFEYSDLDLLSLGRRVAVRAGDEQNPVEIFRGDISALEFVARSGDPPQLVVLAEDALQKSRMRRRTELHENRNVAELVQAVAARIGLRPVVDRLQERLDPVMQLNESDLAFLRRLLARFDADLQVVGEELHASPRADVRRGTITLELGSQLFSVRVMADLAGQATAVTFSGWDAGQGQAITATSTLTSLGPGQGRTGSAILGATLGERNEHLGNLAVKNESEARAVVNAAHTQRARQFLRVEGESQGNPSIRVGTHLALSGLGPRFDNSYYVTAVRHRYDLNSGYCSLFEAEGAFFGG
jgi:phage protein D